MKDENKLGAPAKKDRLRDKQRLKALQSELDRGSYAVDPALVASGIIEASLAALLLKGKNARGFDL